MNKCQIGNLSLIMLCKLNGNSALSQLANSIDNYLELKNKNDLIIKSSIIDLKDKIKDEKYESVHHYFKDYLIQQEKLLEDSENVKEEYFKKIAIALSEQWSCAFEMKVDFKEKQQYLTFFIEYAHVSPYFQSVFEDILKNYYNTRKINYSISKFEIIPENNKDLQKTEDLKVILSDMTSDYNYKDFQIVIVN